VCGGQINEEGRKELVYMGYRHTTRYKKAQCSKWEAGKGKSGSGLMSAQKEQSWVSRVGSVPGLV
jgi:hypothetical protein